MLASSVEKKEGRVGLVAEEISNGIWSMLFLNHWFKSSLGQYREQKSLHFNGAFECFLPCRRCIRCIEDVFTHRYPQRTHTASRLPHAQGNKWVVSQYLLGRPERLWPRMASVDIFIRTFSREDKDRKSKETKSSSPS